MIFLGVNIDHVATLRQVRYRDTPQAFNVEPDPIAAALASEDAGASGITAHLRADRRHIQDADLWKLKEAIRTKLNLEMGNTPEIVEIALRLSPQDICLVPEERLEVTTEGGLDCVGLQKDLLPTVSQLQQAKIRVSLFIDPDGEQVRAVADLGAQVIELHTGAYANAESLILRQSELQRLQEAALLAHSLGLRVNAGHGLNYANVQGILDLPYLEELNIGHSIICRALTVGLPQAVRDMLVLISSREN